MPTAIEDVTTTAVPYRRDEIGPASVEMIQGGADAPHVR